MADIVVFYAREDYETVKRLVEILRRRWTVWWDQVLLHGQWDTAVEAELQTASCAIPVWSHHSLSADCMVRKEAAYAGKRAVPLLHVLLQDVELPLQFTDDQTNVLTDWDKQEDSREIEAFFERVAAVLRNPTALRERTRKVRPDSLAIDGRTVQLPCFVRSVSSHETLLTPRSALLALAVHPSSEPVLVSAFDMHPYIASKAAHVAIERQEMEERLTTIRERSVVFLDSGNYEAFRTGERAQEIKGKVDKSDWTAAKFHKVVKKSSFDVAFSFDDTDPPQAVREICRRICAQVTVDVAAPGARQVIPIVHTARGKDGKRRTDLLPDIVKEVAQRLDCPIVAVTERELGDGLFERARTVMKIRESLDALESYKVLHLLGAGNPISIAVLAAAGADLFDGLEWCRVVVDYESARLHHPQHFDFFANHAKFSEFQTVREFVADKSNNYYLRLLVHNIDFFQRWVQELRASLKAGEVGYMLQRYLGKEPFAQLRAELPEVLR